MDFYTLLGMGIGVLLILVVLAIFMPLAKKFRWGLDAKSLITLQPGETLIASIVVTWKHKAFYLSRHSIPQGTLDITDQRLVFTGTSGKKADFELKKEDIAEVRNAGLFLDVRTKDRESYLIGSSWKKELKGYLAQMGLPLQK